MQSALEGLVNYHLFCNIFGNGRFFRLTSLKQTRNALHAIRYFSNAWSSTYTPGFELVPLLSFIFQVRRDTYLRTKRKPWKLLDANL